MVPIQDILKEHEARVNNSIFIEGEEVGTDNDYLLILKMMKGFIFPEKETVLKNIQLLYSVLDNFKPDRPTSKAAFLYEHFQALLQGQRSLLYLIIAAER